MADLLFRTEDSVFSYRVAGICIQNGRLLLQRPSNDSGFAFPGGHAAFGETNEETLIREFREEIGAFISVKELKWAGELFFRWGDVPCHQICLYYRVSILNSETPGEGMFMSKEQLERSDFELEFHWVPLDQVDGIELYPANAAGLLRTLDQDIQHFVYRE